VAFYAVYILEAHSSDGWNLKGNVSLLEPANYQARGEAASSCVRNLGIKIPALVDNFENTTETAYTAWPDRLYVIGRDGKIAYKSAPGPWGFHPARVEQTLKRIATIQ